MPSRRDLREAQEAIKREEERQIQLQKDREKNLERIETERKQNALRYADIGDSVRDFEHLYRKVQDRKTSLCKEDEWKKYLKCDNMPNPKVPAEIRMSYFQWQISLQDHWNDQIHWWLKCNDRSTLTQDPMKFDERRVTMRKLRGSATGKFYDYKLRKLLKIYESLMDALRRKKMSDEHYEDLITIRDELRQTAFHFLDVLSFEVIMHVDREMTSVDALRATFAYTSPDFKQFIWSYKDVPLPWTHHKNKRIQMEPVGMTVTISTLFDLSSAAVRGLLMKQDFLSDYCPSFHPPRQMIFENLSSTAAKERSARKELTDTHLEEIKKVRKAYDIKMEAKRKEEEKNKKGRKPQPVTDTSKKPKKIAKEPPEPPIVDAATYVDVEAEFCALEAAQAEEDRECFKPENLGLKVHEVNMRQHQIFNGIFKVECFERPSQPKEISSQMILQLIEHPNILKPQEFGKAFEPPSPPKNEDPRKSAIGDKFQDAIQNALAELMKVEIMHNEKFLFEAPTVCRWEPWEESDEFAELEPEVQQYNLKYYDYVKKESEKLFAARNPCHYKKKVEVPNFELSSAPQDVKLSELFKNFVVPTMPVEFKFFKEQMEIFNKRQRQWREILETKKDLEDVGQRVSTVNFTVLLEETKKRIDVLKITPKEFSKLFDEKSFTPRNLFPVEHRNLIETLEKHEQPCQICDDREMNPSETSLGLSKPIDFEKFTLVELLNQVEKVKESLRPFFPEPPPEEEGFRSTSTARKPRGPVVRMNRAARLSTKLPSHQHHQSILKPSTQRSRITLRPSIRTPSRPLSSRPTADPIPSEDITTSVDGQSAKPELKLIPHHRGKWSTRDVHEQSYDADTRTVTFHTGRLGTFGLAVKKYSNLPLKSWEMWPVIESSERFVLLKVATQHVSIEFKITNDGYTFNVTNHPKRPPVYERKNPVKVFELKKTLAGLNLNIFPEVDASCYVENICEKHKAMEFHTYKSMAVYCLSHNFKSTAWNRWADRRVAMFDSRMIAKTAFRRLMVTPLQTASVCVREACTELDIVELAYEMDPPDQEFQADLLHFLKGEIDKREHRVNLEHFMTMWHTQALLMNIQPLSFTQ